MKTFHDARSFATACGVEINPGSPATITRGDLVARRVEAVARNDLGIAMPVDRDRAVAHIAHAVASSCRPTIRGSRHRRLDPYSVRLQIRDSRVAVSACDEERDDEHDDANETEQGETAPTRRTSSPSFAPRRLVNGSVADTGGSAAEVLRTPSRHQFGHSKCLVPAIETIGRENGWK